MADLAFSNKEPWEVMEVDTDIIAMNCENYGYNYAIIKPDELIIPKD